MHPVALLPKASQVLAFLLGVWLLAGCAAQPVGGPVRGWDAAAGPGFVEIVLPGGPAGMHAPQLRALMRGVRAQPLRYRVIVIPGSGCAGMARIAERYFAGALHAQILVLHKPGVAPQAETAPGDCPSDFVRHDALESWRGNATAALRVLYTQDATPSVATLLLGISEGGELLPALAPEVPHLAGLVLVSSSGLDPQDAGRMQAERLGALEQWQALAQLQASHAPDETVVQGRSLRYWRDIWRWQVQRPLLEGPWPLLQVWGQADALVPPQAYADFAAHAVLRQAPWCSHSFAGADHGLQQAGVDGVQQLWAWLEQWAREPQAGLCAPLQR